MGEHSLMDRNRADWARIKASLAPEIPPAGTGPGYEWVNGTGRIEVFCSRFCGAKMGASWVQQSDRLRPCALCGPRYL